MRSMQATVISILLAAAGLPAVAGEPVAHRDPAGWTSRRLVADGGTLAVIVPQDQVGTAGPLLGLLAETVAAARRVFGPAAAGDLALAVGGRGEAPAGPVPADLVFDAGFRAEDPRAPERIAVAVAGRALGARAVAGERTDDPRAALALYAGTHRLGLERIDPVAARRRWLARVDLAARRGDLAPAAAERGAFFAHQLRLACGDRAFDRALSALAAHRGGALDWPKAVAAFETAAGLDLDWLANPWLSGEAVPSLAVTDAGWRPRPAGDGGVVSATVRSSPALPQRLVVRGIDQRGRAVRQTTWLTGASAPVALRLGAPPVALTVDPEVELLRRLDEGERSPLIGDALDPAADLVVIGTARGGRWATAARALAARTLGRRGAGPPRFDHQLEAAALAAARRVIVLGPPDDGVPGEPFERLRGAGLASGGNRLQVAGRTVAGPRAGLAAALPAGGEGSALLFADAPDPEVLRTILERAPRWEDASYVLVDGNGVVALGLMASGTSSLDVMLGGVAR